MKKTDLTKAAEELVSVLDLCETDENDDILQDEEGNDIPVSVPKTITELTDFVKEAALWLSADSKLSKETVDVLKQMEWVEADFMDLDDDQDPVTPFRMYGIPIPGMDAEEVEDEKPKRKPKKKPVAKKKEPEPEPEVVDEEPPAPTEPEEPPAEKLKKAEPVPTRRKPGPKRGATGPGAYGMAIEIMCSDPMMSLHDLYDAMEENGFHERNDLGSAKTARSVVLRVYNKLQENGYINAQKEATA